jgi:hypothetical protein
MWAMRCEKAWGMEMKREKREREDHFGLRIADWGFKKFKIRNYLHAVVCRLSSVVFFRVSIAPFFPVPASSCCA